MRIPATIEWRAGAMLLGAAAVFLLLLIALTVTRMDVGMEVEGKIMLTETGWVMTTKVPGDRVALLHRCRHLKIRSRGNEVRYLKVGKVSGCLADGEPSVAVRIEIDGTGGDAAGTDSFQVVEATLVQEQGVSILRALFSSILDRPGV